MAAFALLILTLVVSSEINGSAVPPSNGANGTEALPIGYRDNPKKMCEDKLGMESGAISDDQISVSSSIDRAHGKELSRLNGDGSWITYAQGSEYLEIKFKRVYDITGVRTQGLGNLRVTQIQVQYKKKEDQTRWQAVSEDGRDGRATFDANLNSSNAVTIMLPKSIQAQYIRIIPVSWPVGAQQMALRAELLGCKDEPASGCGGARILTSENGSISSPNYPKLYNNNARCKWEIKAPKWKTVTLNVFGLFDIEYGGNPNVCLYDTLTIFDVVDQKIKLIKTLCGQNRSETFHSTGETLLVQFQSDHFEQRFGFKANYTFVNASMCGGPRILSDKRGNFSSNNWPTGNYSNNINCVWDIVGEKDELIEITFSKMDISNTKVPKLRSKMPGGGATMPMCLDDSLQILTSENGGKLKVVKRYCGTYREPQKFISLTSAARVAFRTDSSMSARGFHASYEIVKASQCGGKRDIYKKRGVLTSPGYPNPYAAGLNCVWHIVSDPDKAITITIEEMDLEGENECTYDYLSVYSGNLLVASYCELTGRIEPLTVYGGLMKVTFTSDKYTDGTKNGFRATYAVVNIDELLKSTTSTPTTSTVYTSEPAATTTTTAEVLAETTSLLTTNVVTADRFGEPGELDLATETVQNEEKDDDNTKTGTMVTKEMIKWFIIGLTTVSGVLLIVVTVGVIVCCKHSNAQNNAVRSLQGSFAHRNNSGVMQNHAYDFSVNSTNHSIRSRLMDQQKQPQPETSTLTEQAATSHQGTLRRSPSQDSHIYFSIEECSKSAKRKAANIKTYYRTNNTSDDSTAAQSEYEIDDVTNDADDELLESRKVTAQSESRATLSSDNESLPQCSVTSQGEEIVDNILYQSADDSGK